MIRLLTLITVALAILLPGPVAKADDTAIPDTPAGRQLAAMLDAYNSGKSETMRHFADEHVDKSSPAPQFADTLFTLYLNDGRYQVRDIKASTPESVTVLMEASDTGFWMEISLTVAPQPPYAIHRFGYHHLEMPADLLPHKRLTDGEIRRNINALITTLAAAGQFSGAILVARNDTTIYEKSAGMASRAWNIPNRIDTKFNVASIDKMFTAVAIAQLVEQGKLSYDDTVGKILPGYPNKEMAARVTVRHLLTHTSGLESKSLGEFRKGFRTVSEYLPSFANDPAHLDPGAHYSYSNDGFVLLGAIIEKVSGQDYYNYIHAHIYGPAGMSNSDSFELDTDPPDLATGYMDGPNRRRLNNIFTLPVKGLPNGLGYSTVHDLQKFATALRSHKLLTAASLELCWTVNETHPDYGYGFEISQYNGRRIVGHSGGWSGVTDQMDIYPDLGYTVVILTNIDDSPRTIAYKLREWLTQGLP